MWDSRPDNLTWPPGTARMAPVLVLDPGAGTAPAACSEKLSTYLTL